MAQHQVRLDQIQLLRGGAALLVILSHIHFIGVGAFGVDLFFCISGFIIVFITERGSNAFLLKRLIRILPLYWTMTIFIFFVLLIAPNVFNSAEPRFDWLLKSLFFIPFDRNGYIEPLLGPGWTINYEMFFYFVFYVSMTISHRFRALICSLLLVLLTIIPQVQPCSSVPCGFYTNAILYEFVYGMGLFYLLKFANQVWTDRFKVFFGAIWVMILAYLIFFPSEIAVNTRAFYWGIPTALIFALTFLLLRGAVLNKRWIWLGDISFSLYLTHLFVILGVDRLIHSFSVFSPAALLVAVCAIVVCIIVANLSYRLVEVGLTNWLRKQAKIT